MTNLYQNRLLRLPDVLSLVGLRRSTLYALVASQDFPAPIPLTGSGRAVAWLASDVERWIQSRITQKRVAL